MHFIILYLFIFFLRGGGGGVGRGVGLLTFPTFRVGGYFRWALIRGWALNRINTVLVHRFLVLVYSCRPFLCHLPFNF